MSVIIQVPKEVEERIAAILQNHIGQENSIGRTPLVALVCKTQPGTSERVVRQAIHNLRRDGQLICSMPGVNGGYYLAANKAESKEFREREIRSRALDLLETDKVMFAAEVRKFGEAIQQSFLL